MVERRAGNVGGAFQEAGPVNLDAPDSGSSQHDIALRPAKRPPSLVSCSETEPMTEEADWGED